MRKRIGLGLALVGAAVVARGVEQDDERPLYREAPDDPPGIAAQPVPGAPPAQPVRFGAAASVQVNVDGAGANVPGDAGNEPSITVDPLNPLRMVIGWRQFDTTSSNFRQAGVGYTRDGGRTWTAGVIEPGVFRTDPVLDVDSSGGFYYDSLDGSLTGVQVFTSPDQGESWAGPNPAFGGDKNWFVVDRSGGPTDGNIYETWSVYFGCCGSNAFTRSTDGSLSWSSPSLIAGTPVFGTMAVAADGTLYVAGADPNNYSNVRVARTANPGAGTPTFSLSNIDLGGSVTLSTGPNPGGLLGQVDVDVDRSNGPHAGNVYVLCSVDPPGSDPMDVMFSRSVDGGASWSPAVRLNDDPSGSGRWQWFGTLSVAPNGRLDVIWNDSRNSGQGRLSELFYTSSSDGGATWAANQQLSPVFDSHLGWPNQNKLGDYYDMRSDLVGADLAWAATFNGEQDVYYLRIGDYDCNGNAIGDAIDITSGTSTDLNGNGIPDECECLSEVYCAGAPNSVGPGAVIGFSGTLSVARNDLVLTVSGCPPKKNGLFFFGPQRVQLPFGNGLRCVGGSVRRLGPIQQTGASGNATRAVDLDAAPASVIGAMSTWGFQFWYRDSVGAGTNLSGAIELTFCP
jgi:hypothetical protein